ncbi:hypothetical protein Holit_03375 [Hollandina sp. SP2]
MLRQDLGGKLRFFIVRLQACKEPGKPRSILGILRGFTGLARIRKNLALPIPGNGFKVKKTRTPLDRIRLARGSIGEVIQRCGEQQAKQGVIINDMISRNRGALFFILRLYFFFDCIPYLD